MATHSGPEDVNKIIEAWSNVQNTYAESGIFMIKEPRKALDLTIDEL